LRKYEKNSLEAIGRVAATAMIIDGDIDACETDAPD